jgi:hypothetical protein
MALRSTGPLALLAIATFVACTTAAAQEATAMERMENELCGCLIMVDVKARDAHFDQQVRHCLEVAVVNHPAAMNALLSESDDRKSKGFQLGEIIGRRLTPKCPAMRAVSERLRVLQAQGRPKSES